MSFARFVLLAAAVAGCGTNRPEIPEELLRDPNVAAPVGYPEGPYGTDKGEVVANAEFQGWLTPLASEHTAATLESISLADYYDPNGTRYELVLVNSAALWCSVCQSEHRALPARFEQYEGRGLMLLSALFQDERAQPADLADLTL